MTTMQIMKQVRDLLKDTIKEGGLDDKLNLLMDKSSKPLHTFNNKRDDRTNIRVEPETLERLKSFKLYNTESHSDTILRLLNELDD